MMPQIFFNINDYLFNTNDCIYLLEIISPAIEDWGMVGGKKTPQIPNSPRETTLK